MRCNSCGNEIPNGSKMCPFCNAVIEDGTQNFNESENLNIANDVVNANQSTTNVVNTNQSTTNAVDTNQNTVNAVNGENLGNVENELPIANEEIERVNNLNQGDYIEGATPELPKAEPKSKKGLIIGIIAGVIALVVVLLAVFFYMSQFKSADKRITNVVNKAFSELKFNNDNLEKASGNMSVDGKVSVGSTSYSASFDAKYGVDMLEKLINFDITLNNLNIGMELLDEPLHVNTYIENSKVYALFSNFYDKYVYTNVDGMDEIFNVVEQNDIDYKVVVDGFKEAMIAGLKNADKKQNLKGMNNVIKIELTASNQKKITEAAKKSALNNDKFLTELTKLTGKDIKTLKSELENENVTDNIKDTKGYIELVTNFFGSELIELNVKTEEIELNVKDKIVSFKLVQDSKTIGEGKINLETKKNAKTKDTTMKIEMTIYVENQAYSVDLNVKVSDDVNPSVEKADLKNSVNIENMGQDDMLTIYDKVSKFGKLGVFISQYLTGQSNVTDNNSIITAE